jgi:cell division transport system permease protein
MRALTYFLSEAAASLWRRRRAAAVAILTIAAGLFVLGFFLVLNLNLDRVVGRWTESAELSVYFADEATEEETSRAEAIVESSGLAASWERLSKEQAAARFREDFPDLGETAAQMDGNPFPASLEVRLRPDQREAGAAVDALARDLGALPGVADVRYDRRWIARLNAVVRLVRGLGLLIIGMLAVASALTVANVVRLAAAARRDEIQIMQLVGAPFRTCAGRSWPRASSREGLVPCWRSWRCGRACPRSTHVTVPLLLRCSAGRLHFCPRSSGSASLGAACCWGAWAASSSPAGSGSHPPR